MLTFLAAALLAALPTPDAATPAPTPHAARGAAARPLPALDRDMAIELEGDIRFLGSEMPAEVVAGGTLDLTLYFVISAPLPPDVSNFLHLESSGDCRIVFDRPLPPPSPDGLVTHRVQIPIPANCGPGTSLKIATGFWARGDGHRYRVLQPPTPDNRIYGGTFAIVSALTPAADSESASESAINGTFVFWDIPKLTLDEALASRHPPWALPVGIVLLLGLLALTRRTRLVRQLALDRPRLYAGLDPLRLFERLATAVAVIWAAIFIIQYLSIALDTLGYPYQFEWMEGGVLETVQRLRDGQSIYGPPTVEYVPYIYTPGYIGATWLVSLFTGVDFFAARLVSFLAILGVAFLIYRIVVRETQSRLWALIGVACLFATFALSGRWYHLARVDSLYLLLLILPLYLLRFRSGLASAVLAGLLMTACFMTKQAAPIALLPPVGLLFLADSKARRRTFLAGVVFIATTLVTYLVAQAMTDGWFGYYIFEVPRQHDIIQGAYRGYWLGDLWPAAPLLCMSVLGLGLFAARAGRRAWLYVGVFIGFMAAAWISRLHSGGYANVLIPGFAAMALVAPLGLATLDETHLAPERARLGGSPTRIGLAAFLAFQFFALSFSSAPSLPPPGDLANGTKFVAYLAQIDGDVLLPDFDFIQRRAGKKDYSLGMASRDLLRLESPDDRGKLMLEADIQKAFVDRRFAAVILSEEDHLRAELMPHYCFKERVDFAPTPTTGWVNRPQWVWVPRPPGADPSSVACPKAPPHPRPDAPHHNGN